MSDKKWKSHFLSSSLPLEFEAAKTLSSKGFIIDADFTYKRYDETGLAKDFSVDVRAMGFPPYRDPNILHGTTELLVECKHRVQGTKWLFLPDINRGVMSHIILGCAVRAFDEFSPFLMDGEPNYEFSRKTPCCYKGVEVQQGERGGVHEAEIKHGIAQLRYALPYLMTNQILTNLTSHADDISPFFLCPILLTTAELIVIDRRMTAREVEAADDPSELGKAVPYLITYSSPGPDFERHVRRVCKPIRRLVSDERVQELEKLKVEFAKKVWQSRGPLRLMSSLPAGETSTLEMHFGQFIVCSKDRFPQLIDKIKRLTCLLIHSRKDLRD